MLYIAIPNLSATILLYVTLDILALEVRAQICPQASRQQCQNKFLNSPYTVWLERLILRDQGTAKNQIIFIGIVLVIIVSFVIIFNSIILSIWEDSIRHIWHFQILPLQEGLSTNKILLRKWNLIWQLQTYIQLTYAAAALASR